ncbi:rRNA (guanine-N(2)-)-methyltransferase [Caldicellulosiruptor obsidiansis OB47]|uniref:rRNA (Guanine-N(2)-)-methyltransferase n=1 Tax=Caldicellulosiruptor obsidiansis (strain ATCC BAA-2073 / JCM 16842 / OB47) TaxID=608506 RepID=D9TF89_CALOO|nr:class I SAM-dependent RNA methyltransferase [Caldicellulosiruptor obsidiansis]ADL42859.1 rRNA (guanine-N(2)-)-methyltransferase [Caldicellulosiruptor obsidiansis OB47]
MIELFIATPLGTESVAKEELIRLGYKNLKVENGRILVSAKLEDIPKLNINLRTSNRIFAILNKFKAQTFDELFDGVYSYSWHEILPKDAKILVTGRTEKSKLFSIRACQSITKKAIVEKLKSKYNVGFLEESGELFKIEIAMINDWAYLLFDTTGDSLHKRGYRKLISKAPLKENIAATLVLLAKWQDTEEVFWDPFCGSGTIAIEAAMVARNIAPGINRTFLAEKNGFISQQEWKKTRLEAIERIDYQKKFEILSSDIDESMIYIAKANAKEIGVDKDIRFFRADARKIKKPSEKGIIVTNPPYGERIDDMDIFKLYRDFGRCLKTFDNWRFFMLSAYNKIEKAFGRKADKNRKIYNGKIKTYLYFYFTL